MEVKYVKSSPFLYLNRIHIATFLPFRAYNTDNQLIIDSLIELARRLNLSVESTALAAGWLARENKICIQRKNGLIALSDESAFPFSFG